MVGDGFLDFPNVELLNADLSNMGEEELEILNLQARYCQAMTEADTQAMSELTDKELTFVHMSGRRQTREEYFSDIDRGKLRYHSIGIENPTVSVNGDNAKIAYTSVLKANAYGLEGTYRMEGTHYYNKRDGVWVLVNAPKKDI